VEAVIICVPTPLNKNREPDISYIIETGKAIAPHLQKGTLVVLESTTYPGTTDEDLREVPGSWFEDEGWRGFPSGLLTGTRRPRQSGQQGGEDSQSHRRFTPACLEKTKALYGKALKTLVPVSSCRAAEATKLLENIFRGVNIALVNELKMVYGAMDIDVWEVINAAKTKPFGFMAFYPGPGLGRSLHPD
jgi:UDP-N-acetyl-D-glucosamine dehydrogenase